MRLASWKRWSLGLAMVGLMTAAAASAQSLAGVTTQLDRTLDSKNAKVGEVVTAKVRETVKADGLTLPRGTELVGKVADVKTAQDGKVSVSLVFTEAKLKGGREIPVKATVIGAYPASAGGDGNYNATTMGPVPSQVPNNGVYTQQGTLGNVNLSSAVANNDSATFTSNGHFKLEDGTYLQLGVAPTSTASGTNAAE